MYSLYPLNRNSKAINMKPQQRSLMGILDKIVFCSGAFFNYYPARKEQLKKNGP